MNNTDTELLLTHRELKDLHDYFEPASLSLGDTQFQKRTFRSLFISDTHIGRHDCKTDRLTMFLDLAQATEISYFAGDIIDWWLFRASQPHHLGRIFKDDTRVRTAIRFFQYGLHFAMRAAQVDMFKPKESEMMRWPQGHNDPLQKMFRLIRKGQAILMGGNHDELLRGFTNNLFRMGGKIRGLLQGSTASREVYDAYFRSPSFGNLDVVEEIVHQTLNGHHLHVCHGDRFDPPLKQSRSLGIFATRAFHNGIVPLAHGVGLKGSAEQLTNYVNDMDSKQDLEAFYDRYADFLDEENRKIGLYNQTHPGQEPRPLLRGGIHGHVHNPGIRNHRGYVFMDIGDFVLNDHCTSIVEHSDGKWQIMTVDRVHGIYPHPSTPKPVDIFAADRSTILPQIRRRTVAPA